jgi:hypothetical protein
MSPSPYLTYHVNLRVPTVCCGTLCTHNNTDSTATRHIWLSQRTTVHGMLLQGYTDFLATLYVSKYKDAPQFPFCITDLIQKSRITYNMYSLPLPLLWWPMAVEVTCILQLLYPQYPLNRKLDGPHRLMSWRTKKSIAFTSIKYK